MRQVVLDTETTGLETHQGHRIIEIGCVELVNRRLTGRHLHYYLQPDRDIEAGAFEVHGISAEFLQDRPRFTDVADEFLRFVADAEVVIHNADFDVDFIDSELGRLDGALRDTRLRDHCAVLDTLALARELHPGQRNSLDALCKRYEVDNSQRDLHGALLDAEILADVYLMMTGGQASLDLATPRAVSRDNSGPSARAAGALRVILATDQEQQSHQQRLAQIEVDSAGTCLWLKLDREGDRIARNRDVVGAVCRVAFQYEASKLSQRSVFFAKIAASRGGMA